MTEISGPSAKGLGPDEASLTELFFARADAMGEAPFLWHRRHRQWHSTSWFKTADSVKVFATALRQRGISQGDRVAILSENNPGWVIADLAIMLVGAISVPLFTTHTQSDIDYLLGHSGAKAVICSSVKMLRLAEPAATELSNCHLIVVMTPPAIMMQPPGLAIVSWDQMMAEGRIKHPTTQQSFPKLRPDDVCCIIYTHTTSERPRGAMLTHRSIMANLAGAEGLLRELSVKGAEVFLSVLPLSHAYEHSIGLFFPIHLSAQIYFLPRPEGLFPALQEVRPTVMTAVPRLFEVMQDRLLQTFKQKSKGRGYFLNRTVHLGQKKARGLSLNLFEIIENKCLDILMRRRFHQRFGGRLKAFVSGGAALDPQVGNFFLAIGIRLLQGYGQTEASPVISANPPTAIRIETVGKPLAGIKVKTSSSGELLVKGPNIMAGYWQDNVSTRKVLRGGWLHTGDLAEIQEDGYILLTGRKKDIIINSGGDNISPIKIEAVLRSQPDIAQAAVFGNRQPYVTAVITPAAELVKQHADRPDKIRTLVSEAVETANANLSPIERVRHFILSDEPFSVANKCLTATQNLRRNHLNDIYLDRIQKLYRRR